MGASGLCIPFPAVGPLETGVGANARATKLYAYRSSAHGFAVFE